MLALHDLDIMAYAVMLYDLLCEYAEDGVFTDPFRLDSDAVMSRAKQVRVATTYAIAEAYRPFRPES